MSRSGYSENIDNWDMIKWRGVIASATRGKRGQQFFRDIVSALDAMPVKELIYGDLQTPDGGVCALGCLAKHKGISVEKMDTENYEALGKTFNIAPGLAQEVMFMNDEYGPTPQRRWQIVRDWAEKQIKKVPPQ